MKRQLLLCLLCAILGLSTACVIGPGPGAGTVALSGARSGIYGFQGRDLHFLIVTDGTVGSGGYNMRGNLLFGTYWSGKIRPAAAQQPEIAFSAGSESIRIGEHQFSLGEGRAFVVSTKTGTPEIQQIKFTPRDQVLQMVQGDKRFELP